jgi:uncharacterized membrane protein
MAYYVKLYFATLLVFLVVDVIWLGFLARTFYKKHLGFLLAPSPNWMAAAIFYLLFILAILVFVVVPGIDNSSLRTTLLRAALFGLITYGTYDLTNLATVKDWPLLVTVVDMIWGAVLSVVVGLAGVFFGRWMA